MFVTDQADDVGIIRLTMFVTSQTEDVGIQAG